MARREFDPQAPYQSIRGTARITGLSQIFIRSGCKAGTIPHVMCGSEYRINVPLFMEQLNAQAASSIQEGR